MSMLIPGKRYRYTVEGVADKDGGLKIAVGELLTDCPHHGAVELLPEPLPTTPGSVIRHTGSANLLFYTRRDNKWVDEEGRLWRTGDLAAANHFTVIFDAGADK